MSAHLAAVPVSSGGEFRGVPGVNIVAMKIELREFDQSDLSRLKSWIQSPEALHDWAGNFFSYPLTDEQLHSYLESAGNLHGGRRIFKSVDPKNGEAVGHIELSHIWPHLSARISRVLIGLPELRGAGLGHQMVQQLVVFAFDEFEFDRLDAGVSDTNTTAIRCYEKAGFSHVGTWPRAMSTTTSEISVLWMSLFKSQWKQQRRPA